MRKSLKKLRPAALLLAALLVVSMSPISGAYAQGASTSTPTSATLSESTIRALQEALNKQGITVKTDGVLNDETRNALRNFQSKHHLPVTGEADKATLDKLGVAGQLGTQPSSTSTVGQAASPSAEHDHSHGSGGTASGPMMPGMMQGMMQAMHGMMGMMHGQMQPGSMQRGLMMPQQDGGPMRPQQGGPMNCPMMSGSNQASGPPDDADDGDDARHDANDADDAKANAVGAEALNKAVPILKKSGCPMRMFRGKPIVE